MPSTFMGLNTALSGLNYYQASLNTTAHNISNADTEGYSKQQVQSKAAQALRLKTSYGMLGTGVETTTITQLRNVYYDTKYRNATTKCNQYDSMNEQLKQLQSYMNEIESETGYTALLTEIESCMQDLTTNPSDATYRTQLIQSLSNFTDYMQEIATNFQNTQEDINNEVAIHVDTINSIATQIYTLNEQIRNLETRNGNANDLRDQRERLVDQLSELVNVTVIETPIMYGNTESGATHYEVRIGNSLLVDDMECRQLKVKARTDKINQNDITGLYDVYWAGLNGSIGEKFDFNSENVEGKIKGLLAIRDGNNVSPFSGTISSMEMGTENGSVVTVELSEGVSIDELNLPQNGIITLNCKEYHYSGWEQTYDEAGNLNNFVFKNVTVADASGKKTAAEFNEGMDLGKSAVIGQSIDTKGIPYYMSCLNEFVRTFSSYMNNIFKSGVDANGDPGLDLFTAKNLDGEDFEFSEELVTGEGFGSADSTYYQITALNWSVNQEILLDPNKFVVSYKEDVAQGNKDAKGVLEKMLAGMNDQSMYSQGTPAQFMQSVTTTLAVDVAKYSAFTKNMDEVATVIDNQRMSVSSVDTNEEATSLVMYKNGYNLACKIISTMNEVYDKLINGTA